MSLQQVANVAGVSPGSLYQYFPDKASLVAEIVERQSTRELAFHMQRFSTMGFGATLKESLTMVVASVVTFQKHEGPLMRRTLASMQYLGRYEQLGERSRRAAQFITALLEFHKAELTMTDLQLATHVVSNALHSLTHDGVLARPDSLDDDTLVANATRLAHAYLTAR